VYVALKSAAEIDSTLAEIAATNLTKYDHVTVLNRDGTDVDPVPCDAILINAGVTHPHPAWLDAIVVGITRRHDQFAAELLSIITIYSSPSMRDPMLQSMLNDSFEIARDAAPEVCSQGRSRQNRYLHCARTRILPERSDHLTANANAFWCRLAPAEVFHYESCRYQFLRPRADSGRSAEAFHHSRARPINPCPCASRHCFD
jgi:hypothetical protein